MQKKLPDGILILTAYEGEWTFYRCEMVEDLVMAGMSVYGILLFEYVFFELKVDILRLDMDADTIKNHQFLTGRRLTW